MPIDTPNKRRSVFGWGIHPVGPIADGTIDAADRIHISGRYSGIAITAAVAPEFVSYRGTVTERNVYSGTVES